LPIGNGRLAAMITGDANQDVLSLNHEWLWRGVHRDRDNKPVARHLPAVRDLLREGDFFRATAMGNAFFGGQGGTSQLPNRVDAYQPAGDLVLQLGQQAVFEYRELDLETGVARARRRLGDGTAAESCFLVHPDLNLLAVRWTGINSGRLAFTRQEDPDAEITCRVEKDQTRQNIGRIEFSCRFRGGLSYRVAILLCSDGLIKTDHGQLLFEKTDCLTAYVNIATSVRGVDEELADYPFPLDMSWPEILDSHSRRFADMMGRLSLDLTLPANPKPTDERIQSLKIGMMDPALLLLYFNYGRYLLVASSICGELPANLQGKWNDSIHPPWECDYHFDINLQMNYWLAEPANLSECAEALIRFIERFVPHAQKAASDLYGCRGVFLPIQTDAWGRATPESYGWSVWIGAAPWIAWHFWSHYAYTGDLDFLRNRAYPFFREVARFYEDYLVPDEAGILQIMPSQSPENRFTGTGSFPVSLGISAAMDVQLAYDALSYAVRSAQLLDIDPDDARLWLDMQAHLPAFAIGQDGRLLEWETEREEVEPGHRHLSHLYGLYPSDLFNPESRPDQYQAAIRSLKHRLAQGGGHTGWSRAWVACLSARVGDASGVLEHLSALIKDFATVSLLDLHPPRIFQIDGNLGAVAAVLESLAQFWNGRLHLLRALPAAWPDGSLKGLKVPGGHTVSLTWQGGRLTRVEATIGFSGVLNLETEDGRSFSMTGRPGECLCHCFNEEGPI
jgi:alpha-L-fucosidase 2